MNYPKDTLDIIHYFMYRRFLYVARRKPSDYKEYILEDLTVNTLKECIDCIDSILEDMNKLSRECASKGLFVDEAPMWIYLSIKELFIKELARR